MVKQSAGILLYRLKKHEPEVFLVHPGGPFWSKKDAGVWSIPKGEIDEKEEALKVAFREFKEETGYELEGDFMPLQPIKQKSGKIVYAWTGERDVDENKITSNSFEIEWPPKSGKMKSFPEIDKAEWFDIPTALSKIFPSQQLFLHALQEKLKL